MIQSPPGLLGVLFTFVGTVWILSQFVSGIAEFWQQLVFLLNAPFFPLVCAFIMGCLFFWAAQHVSREEDRKRAASAQVLMAVRTELRALADSIVAERARGLKILSALEQLPKIRQARSRTEAIFKQAEEVITRGNEDDLHQIGRLRTRWKEEIREIEKLFSNIGYSILIPDMSDLQTNAPGREYLSQKNYLEWNTLYVSHLRGMPGVDMGMQQLEASVLSLWKQTR